MRSTFSKTFPLQLIAKYNRAYYKHSQFCNSLIEISEEWLTLTTRPLKSIMCRPFLFQSSPFQLLFSIYSQFGKRTPKFWIRLDWIAAVPAGMELFSDLFHATSSTIGAEPCTRPLHVFVPSREISSSSFICLYTVVLHPNTHIWRTFLFIEQITSSKQ